MKNRRPVVRFTAAAFVAAALCTAWGCDDSDSVQAELDRAEIVLNALSAPGAVARPTDDRKRDDLQWVIDRLNGRKGKGIAATLLEPGDFTAPLDNPSAKPKAGVLELDEPASAAVDAELPGQAAAANMLVSRAQAGLGEIQAGAHAHLEAALLNQLAIIRAVLGEWYELNSQAAGLETYDPTPDVRQLEAQIAERQTELAAAQRTKADADAAIAALEAEAESLTTRGAEARARETSLREGMINASETERLRILEEAMRHRREADEKDKEASVVLARAASQRPEAATLGGRVNLIESQIRYLREGIQSVRDRAEQNRVAAAEARAAAGEAAQRLDGLITQAAATRTNADAPADEAVRLYGQAQSAATKAAGKVSEAATKGQALSLAAAAAQATADVQATRARGLSQFAATMRSVAENPYKLPNNASYAQRAGEAGSKASEALNSARSAYTEAQEIFGRVGTVSGPAKEMFDIRMKSIEAKLGQLAGTATSTVAEGEPVVEGEPAASSDSADPGAGSGAGGDEATIAEARAFLQGLIDQSRDGNLGSVVEAMAFEDSADAEMARAIIPLAQSIGAFNTLCKETYGSDLAELVQASSVPSVKANPMLSMMGPMVSQMGSVGLGMNDLEGLNAADVPMSVQPDGKVRVEMTGEGSPVVLSKADGAWKISVPPTGMGSSPAGQQVKMMLPMFKPMAGVFDEVATKIRGSEYADADAMLVDLSARLAGAMGGVDAEPDADGEGASMGGGLGGG